LSPDVELAASAMLMLHFGAAVGCRPSTNTTRWLYVSLPSR
jgi:hypothetical protein